MGKYLARGHGVQIERSETNFLEVLTREVVRFCSRAVRLFPAPLAQIRTALIRDFHQWFCKESAHWVVRVI